ncbi:MAG: tetratricopeptide repeat protein [Candidatus Moranbacteria bacterium]|nr:tetratricopeptide repeat protein [Candidatus Moranbacteria bacterium]
MQNKKTIVLIVLSIIFFGTAIFLGVLIISQRENNQSGNQNQGEELISQEKIQDLMENAHEKFYVKGNYNEGLAKYQEAYETAPENHQTSLALAEAYINKSQYQYEDSVNERAEKLIKEALSINPESAEAHILKGRLKAMNFQCDEAIENYERAIEIEPNNVNAYLGKIDCMNLSENEKAIKAALEKAYEIDPANSATRLSLASNWFIPRKEFNKAEIHLRKALNKTSGKRQKAHILTVLGMIQPHIKDDRTKEEKVDEALREYLYQAIEVDSNYALAHAHSGKLLADKMFLSGDHFKESLAVCTRAFNKAQEINPKSSTVHYLYGYTLRRLALSDIAKTQLEASLQLVDDDSRLIKDRDRQEALLNFELAGLYNELEETDKSLDHLDRAMSYNHDNTRNRFIENLGTDFYFSGTSKSNKVSEIIERYN